MKAGLRIAMQYEVGTLYNSNRTRWPKAVQYNFRAGFHELLMFLPNLSPLEVRDIMEGRCEFAFLEAGDVIVFLFRIGGTMPWGDALYSWHMIRERNPGEAILPEAEASDRSRILLHVFLVEATTGILKGIRDVSLSPEFSAALQAAIRQQAERPWPGEVEYTRQVEALYQRYPKARDMLRHAAAKTRGGA